MTLSGGDVLARGGKSAQFAGGADVSDFVYDLANLTDAEVMKKYNLTPDRLKHFQDKRAAGEFVPALPPYTPPEEGFEVIDRRPTYFTEEASPEAEELASNFPAKQYGDFVPVMDRLLVKVVSDNPDEVVLKDGSVKNVKTGLVTAAKYRQHSRFGVVVSAGTLVVISGKAFPMSDFVSVGDKVMFGDYNSELLELPEYKARPMVEKLGIDYTSDDEFRIIRVQDVRGVQKVVS